MNQLGQIKKKNQINCIQIFKINHEISKISNLLQKNLNV